MQLRNFYKQLIKQKSTKIKAEKLEVKKIQRQNHGCGGVGQYLLHKEREEIRYLYLSYALARGKLLDKVEPKQTYSLKRLVKYQTIFENLYQQETIIANTLK